VYFCLIKSELQRTRCFFMMCVRFFPWPLKYTLLCFFLRVISQLGGSLETINSPPARSNHTFNWHLRNKVCVWVCKTPLSLFTAAPAFQLHSNRGDFCLFWDSSSRGVCVCVCVCVCATERKTQSQSNFKFSKTAIELTRD